MMVDPIYARLKPATLSSPSYRIIHLDVKPWEAKWSDWTFDYATRFSLSGRIVSHIPSHQMWELIIEKDDIQESCRWFRKWDFATAFATNKLA